MRTLVSLILCLLVATAAAQTETERDFGDYIVYFNVVNSSLLTPEVAEQYDIIRSRRSAIITIAVQKKSTQDTVPVEAILKGDVRNIVGQLRPLEFLRIQEGRAIYYLSDFQVADNESLDFHINIRPDANAQGFDLDFTKQVFVE